jgi:hypothetical protein
MSGRMRLLAALSDDSRLAAAVGKRHSAARAGHFSGLTGIF